MPIDATGPIASGGEAPLLDALSRIAAALERLSPPRTAPTLEGTDAFVWNPRADALEPVRAVSAVPFEMLAGIDRQGAILLANTERFARGAPANNAMLWGARGTGKSSLVKAVHRRVVEAGTPLVLGEIQRDDLSTLPTLLDHLRRSERRVVLFCDDLSFEREDADYKALKSVLDGGIRGRPANVLFYATSNRRHLMPRDMADNQDGTAINPGEAVEEKISLSDRFGLWLGFHAIDQDTYLAMVERYAAARALLVAPDALRAQALEWSITRGARSGRVAFQFIEDLTGRLAP